MRIIYLYCVPVGHRTELEPALKPDICRVDKQECFFTAADLVECDQICVCIGAQLTQTPGSMRSVTVGPSKDFYYAIQNHVSDMLTRNLSPEETAALMIDELNGLLLQYSRANP